MKDIFVDTSAFVAIFYKQDQFHKKAIEIRNELQEQNISYVTTNFVLDESITLLRQLVSHSSVVSFYKTIKNSDVFEIIHISEHLENLAWNLFEKYSDKEFSFTDCTSFVVMKQFKLDKCFTNDHHFKQMGFETLIK